MNPIVSEFVKSSQATISHLKEDLKSIRTGRANPALLEGLMVDAYGGSMKMKLMEMATITTEGPSMLVVTPFDPSTANDIEKAILTSPLNLSAGTQGHQIRVKVPQLNEEQRQKYVKLLAQKVEEKKQIIRNHREDARKKIKSDFDAKVLTEDQKFRLEKDIDTETGKLNEEIQNIKDAKEEELLAV